MSEKSQQSQQPEEPGCSASSLLRIRPFRLYFISRTTSVLGDAMLPVAMSFAVLHAGYGTDGLGFVLALYMVTFVAFVMVGGTLADRIGPRPLMLGSDAVCFVVQGAAAVAIALGRTPLAMFFVCCVVMGVSRGLFQPGVGSVVPQVAGGHVQRANGLIGTSTALVGVVGAGCAGGLVAVGGAATVYGVDAASYLVSAICMLLLPLPKAVRADDARVSWRADMAEGWREFTSRTWFWSVIAVFAFMGLASTGPFSILMTSFLTERHGSAVFGLVLSCQGLGAVLGGLTAVRLRPSRPLRIGFILSALITLPMFTLALGAPIAVTCAAALIGGWGRSYQYILWTATEQVHVPAPILNRLYAYDVAGCLSLFALGQALGGPMSGRLGDKNAMLTCAAMSLIGCAVILMVPAVRRLPADPDSPDGVTRPERRAVAAGAAGV